MEGVIEAREDLKPSIPDPDLDNLKPWLENVIDQPAKTYQTGTKPNGTLLTTEEKLNLTRLNLSTMVNEHKQLREAPDERTRSHAMSDEALKRELIASVREGHLSRKFK